MTAKNNIPAGYKDSAVGIIPQEWEVKRIKDLGSVITGSTPPTADVSNYGSEYMFVSPADLSDNQKYVLSTEKMLSSKGYAISRKMPKGTILYTCIGSTIGKIGIASRELTSNQQINAVICNDKNEYLYYALLLTTGRIKMLAGEQAVPIINKSEFENIKLAVPPLEEQRKIAEILGVWDEAIEKQSRLIKKLELRKRALMQHLLTGRTRLPGFTTPWQKVSYSEILKEVKRNMIWDDNEEYDLISVKRRSEGLFHRDRLLGKDIKTKNLRPAKLGDFLISKMQIVHGASGLVTEEFDGMKISGSYIALVAKNEERLDINFINWYSKTPYFYHQTYISSYGVHIEKMTFDLESFMSMNICIPSLSEQKAIAEVLTMADNEIATHRKKLDALRLQKRGLMQQLLTGKIRVKI